MYDKTNNICLYLIYEKHQKRIYLYNDNKSVVSSVFFLFTKLYTEAAITLFVWLQAILKFRRLKLAE